MLRLVTRNRSKGPLRFDLPHFGKGRTMLSNVCVSSQTPLDQTPGPRNARTKYSAPDLSLRMHTWMRPSRDLRHLGKSAGIEADMPRDVTK